MRFYGKSDVGQVRSENQDRFGIFELLPGVTLCVICDGMGGNAGGSVASGLAIDAFTDMMREVIIPDSPEAVPEISDRTVREALREAVRAANRAVWEKARESNGRFDGMGTTLVALLMSEEGRAWAVNVGDSRIYRVLPDRLISLTRDHSYVQQLVDAGTLSREEARTSPDRNIITKAVGTAVFVEGDVTAVDLEPIDGYRGLFLLCSDGLYSCLDDGAIIAAASGARSLSEMADRLVESANEAGGPDNITVIIAESD
jgi:protein phosphatase